MNKLRFAIGIPTLNRADLLNEALKKYAERFPDIDIFIIDNGNQEIISDNNKIHIYRPGSNIGVAASWNLLCTNIFQLGYANALILNDDIITGLTQESLIEYLDDNEFGLAWSEQNFSTFILPKHTFEKVGPFDEKFFPAYFEDNDYVYRCQLAGITIKKDWALNAEVYRNSMTIEKDPSINNRFNDNRLYYIHKWGGEPGKELYKTPFNL